MSRFYFNDNDPDSQHPSDDESSLPFPAPLSRASFSNPSEFSPSEYLTSLSSRHQTLEDLREELRTLSSSLNNELLDLVNENYTDFLNLGKQLRGGDEKVEEVKVGMLGFQREVEGLKQGIEERRRAMAGAIEEKREVGKEIAMARKLLEIEERIAGLEEKLLLSEPKRVEQNGDREIENGIERESDADFDSEEDESSEDEDSAMVNGEGHEFTHAFKRLRRHVEQYQIVRKLITVWGEGHPFVEAQQSRFEQIRSTLLLDLQNLRKDASSKSSTKFTQEMKELDDLLRSHTSTEIPVR